MEKVSIREFQAFSEERFTKRVVFQRDEAVCFVLNLMPGQALPPHKHPGTGLYLLVLEGEGTLTVDGVETLVRGGDAVYCGGEETFAFANTGASPVSLHVLLNKVPSEAYAKDI